MKVSGVDPTVSALHATLGRVSRRVQAVASNLANVDTPGYRAIEVEFSRSAPAAGELRRSHPAHRASPAPALRGVVVEAPVLRVRQDGNTVDIDREMTLQATLQGRYRAAAEMLRKRFALWRYAVTDGRK